jgi:polar amino acid transport system substrate-binding protein
MMVSPTGNVTGVVSDFLDQVSAHSGCRFEFVVVPRVRAFLMLKSGAVDIVPAVVQTEERDRLARFVHAYDTTPMLMSIGGKLPADLTLADLEQSAQTIGVVRGYDYGPAYMALIEDPKVKPRISLVPDPETLGRMLVAGRIDAVLMVPSAFVNGANAASITDSIGITKIVGMPSTPTGWYINERTLADSDRILLSDAIAALMKQGEYARLLKRYYATPAWALRGLNTDTAADDAK